MFGLLFVLFICGAFGYPTVEDLIEEDYEIIAAMEEIERNQPLVILESATIQPNEKFRLLFVKLVNFVNFFAKEEKRTDIVLSVVHGQDRYSNDTMPRYEMWPEMQKFDKFMMYRLYMCSLCQYLNFFDSVTAIIAVKNKRNGDFSNVLQQFPFDQSTKNCSCE